MTTALRGWLMAGAGAATAGAAAVGALLLWPAPLPKQPAVEAAAVKTAPSVPASAPAAPATALAPLAPKFDHVRIEADGSAVIAGRAAPKAKLHLYVDGVLLAETVSGADGQFALLTKLALGTRPKQLELVAAEGVERQAAVLIVEPLSQVPASAGGPAEVASLDAGPSGDAAAPEASAAAPVSAPTAAEPAVSAPQLEAAASPPAQGSLPPAVAVPETAMTAPETAGTAPEPAAAAVETAAAAPPSASETSAALSGAPAVSAPGDASVDGTRAGLSAAPAAAAAPSAPLGAPVGAAAAAAPAVAAAPPQVLPALPETGDKAATEAVALSSASPALAAAPSAPRVVVADDAGVRVLQSGEAPAAASASVAIDSITYDADGAVILAGRGAAERFVRIYVDNSEVATAAVGGDGQWQSDLPSVDRGIYTLRVDELDGAGLVTSRTETPFQREDAASVAAELVTAGGDPARPVSVVVQPGNTLWGIARGAYGEGTMYVKVFEANRSRIRNPDLIYPGQVFDVPGGN